MRHYFDLFKFWLKVRRANKQLLADVAKHKDDPKYDPPSRDEVLDFIKTSGPFYPTISGVPKPQPYKFPKD